MNSLSTLPRGGQHELRTETLRFPGPDVIPFDAAADDSGGDGPDDFNPAGGGGVVIRLCDADTVVEPGYVVVAISQDDEHDEPQHAQFVSQKLTFLTDAARLAGTVARHPKSLMIPATHVVVNDHRGEEHFRAAVRRAG